MQRVAAIVLVVLLGCLGAAAPAAAKGRKVRVAATEYGKALVDAKGQALYLFTKDRRKRSLCYGSCAEAWPPFITRCMPRALVPGLAARPGDPLITDVDPRPARV